MGLTWRQGANINSVSVANQMSVTTVKETTVSVPWEPLAQEASFFLLFFRGLPRPFMHFTLRKARRTCRLVQYEVTRPSRTELSKGQKGMTGAIAMLVVIMQYEDGVLPT